MSTQSTPRFRPALRAALFALLACCFFAPSAMAGCFEDAKNQYDSCVNANYLFNGVLLQPSEESCAEMAAAANNLCLQAAGKGNPQYSECRVRYDFSIPDCSTCPFGDYYTESAFVNLDAKHHCRGTSSAPGCSGYSGTGYISWGMTVNCS